MTSPSRFQPEFQPHFDGLGAGRISFPHCEACGTVNWYPMKLCRKCQSDGFAWRTVAGKARLWSWTVVRRPFSPQWEGRTPYVVGLVEFDELPGTRLITNIVDCVPEGLAVDAEVEPVFTRDGDGFPLVHFRPLPAASRGETP